MPLGRRLQPVMLVFARTMLRTTKFGRATIRQLMRVLQTRPRSQARPPLARPPAAGQGTAWLRISAQDVQQTHPDARGRQAGSNNPRDNSCNNNCYENRVFDQGAARLVVPKAREQSLPSKGEPHNFESSPPDRGPPRGAGCASATGRQQKLLNPHSVPSVLGNFSTSWQRCIIS